MITADEYTEVYRAIEGVLPPEARKEARAARRQVETAARDEARAAKAREREQRREETARLQPIARANFMVAGVRYEGRQDVIAQCVEEGVSVRLERDPQNAFSSSAIKVVVSDGQQIGFVPEMDAIVLAPVMDQGTQQEAWVTKILGYNSMIPVVQAYLYRANVDLSKASRRPFRVVVTLDAGQTSSVPTTPRPSRDNGVWLIVGGILVIFLLWLVIR